MGGPTVVRGHLPAQDPKLWDRRTRAIVRRGHSWDSILACWFPGASLTTLPLPFPRGPCARAPPLPPRRLATHALGPGTGSMDVPWSCHKRGVSGQAHTCCVPKSSVFGSPSLPDGLSWREGLSPPRLRPAAPVNSKESVRDGEGALQGEAGGLGVRGRWEG